MAESLNRQLKALFERRAAIIVPGAPDALTARMIADAGFEAVYVTGAGVTNAFLGVPDLGLITLSELADNVSAMRDVVGVPIVADADAMASYNIQLEKIRINAAGYCRSGPMRPPYNFMPDDFRAAVAGDLGGPVNLGHGLSSGKVHKLLGRMGHEDKLAHNMCAGRGLQGDRADGKGIGCGVEEVV